MKLLSLAVVALAACTSNATLVHLAVSTDANVTLDQYVLRIGDNSATAAALATLDVEVPAAMAGHSTTLRVWGYSAGQSVAYGTVTVTPVLHATTDATIALAALSCPNPFEQQGEIVCSGEATITCTLADSGCLSWSSPDACAAPTPYCSNGACAATCSNECTTVGQTECDGDQVRTCGTVATDTCLHWSVPAACDMPPAPTCASQTTLTTFTGTCTSGGCAYDPTTVTCTTTEAHATAVCDNAACASACDDGYTSVDTSCVAGKLVLFGGMGSSYLNDTWTFNGSSWTQVSTSTPPSARADAMMATLGSELVLFGGYNNGTYSNDTWTFNGSSWTQVSTSTPPSARADAMMATLGSELVLFGGYNDGTYFNDTWTFNGSSWTQVSTSNPPSARTGALMATLGSELVLFGGYDGTYFNDTWTFDGTSWTQVSTSTPPSARADAMMATLGSELVLFGGYNNGTYSNDTWTFNGSSWTQVGTSTPPSARADAMMATLGSELVLFGGYDNSNLDDTWVFDGTSWTPLTVANPPSARSGAPLTFLP